MLTGGCLHGDTASLHDLLFRLQLPFEWIYYAVVITSYVSFTVVAVLEVRATVIQGQWIMRFVSVFGFLALTVRMICEETASKHQQHSPSLPPNAPLYFYILRRT